MVSAPPRFRGQFYGWIAGVGTAGGTRLVLGHWVRSPFGAFSDVMVAHPDGRRELLAPTTAIGEFITSTYRFDALTLTDVQVERDRLTPAGATWNIVAGPLRWRFTAGARTSLGWALWPIPLRLATTAAFARMADPVARTLLPGVRTIGRAGGSPGTATPARLEWYAGRDLHRISTSTASWNGADLGTLTRMKPAPRFGFSGTPTLPSITRVVSTVSDL